MVARLIMSLLSITVSIHPIRAYKPLTNACIRSCMRQQENQVKLLKMMWSEDHGEKLSAQVQRVEQLVSEIRNLCGMVEEESKDEGESKRVRLIAQQPLQPVSHGCPLFPCVTCLPSGRIRVVHHMAVCMCVCVCVCVAVNADVDRVACE